MKITINGAGLAGSLFAALLSKLGHRVDVFEKRTDPRKTEEAEGRSINLALSARGIEALDKAGLAGKVLQNTIPMNGRQIHQLDGDVDFQPYDAQGSAIRSVSRKLLNEILITEAEKSSKVHFHFEQEAQFINERYVNFKAVGGDVWNHEYELLIGADGANSTVRKYIADHRDSNFEVDFLDHGYKELSIDPGPQGGWKIKKNALHIWPRGQFMLIALPNLDGSFTCTLFLPFEGDNSFEKIQTSEHLSQFFTAYFPDALDLIPDLGKQYFAVEASRLGTLKGRPWHLTDRCLLIGDAAHAIVPFYGQGMNAAFEDCSILFDLLRKYDGNWRQVINEFCGKRKVDTDAIADLALANFIEMRDKVGNDAFLDRKKLEQHIATRFPELWVPMYSQISFETIPYSRAYENGVRQQKLLDELMSEHGPKQKWSEVSDDEILSLLTKYLSM